MTPEPVMRFRAGEWKIAFDEGLVRRLHEMRDARVPSETGGILFGLVDIPAKRIHLVDASAAPPDSDEQPGSFVRSVSGVEELMESVRRGTAGQIRYVGEWHSHPPRSSARPSAVDGQQIDWLAALMGMDSMPALMVIAAERETRRDFCRPARGAVAESSRCCDLREMQMTEHKIGLALSGGGSRAIAFHLGCLRALHDLGILNRVQILSTVSGGSVIGALYAANDEPFPAFEDARARGAFARPCVLRSAQHFARPKDRRLFFAWRLIGGANLCFVHSHGCFGSGG